MKRDGSATICPFCDRLVGTRLKRSPTLRYQVAVMYQHKVWSATSLPDDSNCEGSNLTAEEAKAAKAARRDRAAL